MEVYIFLGIVGLVRLVTGVVLLRLAAQKNLPNLRWLAFGFLATVIDIPFTVQPYVPYVDKAISYIAYLCFALFIARTFYQNKRSPLVPFWAVFTLLYVVMYVMTYRFMNEVTGVGFPQHIFLARPESQTMGAAETVDAVIYGILQIAIWLWHALAGFQALQPVANDTNVENWVKSRYKLIIAYSVLQSLIGVSLMLRPFVASGVLLLSILLVIVTTTMQYLVWVMPEPFRLWLNRGQGAHPDPEEEQRPLSVLDVFSGAIMDTTGLKSIACLYAIRATVGQRIGSEDSTTIRNHIDTMSFNEWETVLRHSELRRILVNSGADRDSADKAIENVHKALVEKQSLLTFSAH